MPQTTPCREWAFQGRPHGRERRGRVRMSHRQWRSQSLDSCVSLSSGVLVSRYPQAVWSLFHRWSTSVARAELGGSDGNQHGGAHVGSTETRPWQEGLKECSFRCYLRKILTGSFTVLLMGSMVSFWEQTWLQMVSGKLSFWVWSWALENHPETPHGDISCFLPLHHSAASGSSKEH